MEQRRSGSPGGSVEEPAAQLPGGDAVSRLVELREPVFGLAAASRICLDCLQRGAVHPDQLRSILAEMIIASERAVAILKR